MEKGQHQLKTFKNGRIKNLYFAYGSNLNKEQMLARCPGAKPVSAAVLPDHKLTYRGNWRGNGVANIEPDKGSHIEGAVYEIDTKDLAALDRYEGYPNLYYRTDITVDTPGGAVRAFAYFMHTERYRPAMPNQGYFNTILKGFQDWGLHPDDLFNPTLEWKEEVLMYLENIEEESV